MEHVDAISTPGAAPNRAFAGLAAELHRAADPRRVAELRTVNTIAELRERADWFRATLEAFQGQGLGAWYAELATRHDRLADEIAEQAHADGIIGGAA